MSKEEIPGGEPNAAVISDVDLMFGSSIPPADPGASTDPPEDLTLAPVVPDNTLSIDLQPTEEEFAKLQAGQESQPSKNKSDQGRFEFWQSKADREKKAREALEAQLKEVESLLPVIGELKKNPEALAEMVAKLKPAAAPAPPEIKAPVKPTRPAGYNDVEAYGDPNSESFKHRTAVEDYREALLEFTIKRQDMKEQELEQERQAVHQASQAQTRLATLTTTLRDGYGFSVPEVQEFVGEMSKSESVTLDNLVTLWQIRKGKTNLSPDARAADMRNRANKINPPPPTQGSEGASTGPAKLSDNDLFNLSLLREKR